MVRFARALVFLPLALLAPACSASHDADDGDAAATAELRALSSAEIIGTLSYGETSAPVSYESTPTYRAFRFQGAAGDQVEAWVRSTDGDARGWIVTSAFKNVVSNDNADGSTLDAKLVATLKSTGTYYVVFRDKASEDATFTVSLAKTNAGGTGGGGGNGGGGTGGGNGGGNGGGSGGGSSSDPFSAASCTGAPLTASDVFGMLDVSRGVLEKKAGRFALRHRSRACYAGQACSAWREGGSEVTAPFTHVTGTFTTDEAERYYRLRTEGDVIVSFQGNSPKVRVRGDQFQGSWGASLTPTYVSQSLELAAVSPGTVNDAALLVDYVWSPSLGCPNGHCTGNASVPGKVQANWSGKPLKVHGVMTKACVRLVQTGSEAKKDANNNDYTLENELVVLGNFANATCQPKTCAEAGYTCGQLDDGCGAKLACGQCSNTQTCETTAGPNHCRPDTAQESCARGGRVYCQGHTGCYDSCF